MSEPNPMAELAEARERFMKDFGFCDHVCSGNCRRVGCNCVCGEWHIEDLHERFNSWLENQ